MWEIKRWLAQPREKSALTALGWAVLNASAALSGIFSGSLVPQRIYGGGGGLAVTTFARMIMAPIDVSSWNISGQLELGVITGLISGRVLFFMEIFGIAVLASFVIADFGRALISFMFAYISGGFLVLLVLIFPGLTGTSAFLELLVETMVYFTFTAFFPIPIFLGFAGTILGVALSERFS
jgi:hypothetical protein